VHADASIEAVPRGPAHRLPRRRRGVASNLFEWPTRT
jgi:hypothetical protein